MQNQQEKSLWETEVGLPDDIDGWIVNPRFGQREAYTQAVQTSGGEIILFLIDLVDEDGEPIGSQGFSIGTGWIVSDDGMEITHPKRRNVVGATLYGQFQNRVRRELGVAMENYGLPTQAKSWDGLGFHWMVESHTIVGGGERSSLMPVEFLGEKNFEEAAEVTAPAASKRGATSAKSKIQKTKRTINPQLDAKLRDLAQTNTVKDFQKLALRIPDVIGNDELMVSVLDEGSNGFWASSQ